MALICEAIASINAFVLSWILVACSSWFTAAYAVCVGWMETVRPTVAAHATWLGVSGEFAFGLSVVYFATMATAGATATAVWYVLLLAIAFVSWAI